MMKLEDVINEFYDRKRALYLANIEIKTVYLSIDLYRRLVAEGNSLLQVSISANGEKNHFHGYPVIKTLGDDHHIGIGI